MCPQCRFEFLAQFVLESPSIGAGEVQDELTRLLVTALNRHHDLDSATAAFRGHQANELEGIRILPNHVEAYGKRRYPSASGTCAVNALFSLLSAA